MGAMWAKLAKRVLHWAVAFPQKAATIIGSGFIAVVICIWYFSNTLAGLVFVAGCIGLIGGVALIWQSMRQTTQQALQWYFEERSIFRFFLECEDKDVEEAYETWARTNLKKIALTALNVDDSDLTREIDYVWGTLGAHPVIVEERDSKGKITKAWPYKERPGMDNIWRGSTRFFAMIMYGKDQMMACTTYYSVTGNTSTRPNTYEYFYQDIVSAESNHESFVLTTSGSTRIEVPLEAVQERRQTGDRERAEGAVRNIRAMLREKKGTR
jgi:hypothetical protein